MTEISEQEARDAAEQLDAEYKKIRLLSEDDDQYRGVSYEIERHEQFLIRFALQELSRRDAERAARQQPITPEWCVANGARLSAKWYWFDEGVQVRPIAGGKWLVIVSGWMLDWSAECVGQVEELRKALKGGTT